MKRLLLLIVATTFILKSFSQSVEAGDYHTLFLCSDSTVKSSGANWDGQIGDGTYNDSYFPVPVVGLNGIIAISAGYHSLALKSDGTVWAWGYNGYGELGDSTYTSSTTPVQVYGLTGIIAISAAGYHSLALKNDGTVWAWGYNGYGQLGDGTTISSFIPVQVSGLSGITSISTGYYHSLAVKNDGTAWGWGRNSNGQLGDGSTTNKYTPVQMTGLSGITMLSGGYRHSIALKNDGTVWATGYNLQGQLGDGTTVQKITPIQTSIVTGMTTISAGYYHSCARKDDGTVWVWGDNGDGQLGDGTYSDSYIPIQVPGFNNDSIVSAGSWHTMALKNDQTFWGWGYNWEGEIGDASFDNDRLSPTQTHDCCMFVSMISLSDTCLTLDTAVIGGYTQSTFEIYNPTCNVMTVSSITSNNSSFTVSPISSSVPPYSTFSYSVTFTPLSLGSHSGDLTINYNSSDTTICLNGFCVQAPSITTNPNSFNINLSCNDSTTSTLNIGNIGLGDLDFSLSIVEFYDGFESGDFTSWNIGSGTYTRQISSTEHAFGNYSFELIGGNGTNWDGINHTFTPSQADYVSFYIMSPIGSTGWTCGVNVGNSSDITSMGAIADSWIDNDASEIYLWCNSGTYTIPLNQGQWYHIEYKNIDYNTKTFNYYINGSLIGAGLQFWNNSLTSIDVVHLMGWDAGNSSYFDEFLVSSTNSPWLSFTPQNGTVIPSGSTNIDVEFNSTGIVAGTHNANLVVSSNDPATPQVTIPCTLNILGAPNMDIILSGPCPQYDTLMVGTAQADTFLIENPGCDTLFITNVTSTSSHFIVDSFPTIIPPFSSAELFINFQPTTVANHVTTITVQNNDADTSFCLQGVSYPAPSITVNPTSFNVLLSCDDSLLTSFYIINSGAGTLDFNIVTGQEFYDGFENGLANWVTGGPTGANWGIIADPYTGSFSLTDSPFGNYGNNWNQYIELAQPLTVTDPSNCNLTFWHKRNLECNYEYLTPQISVNGGPFTDIVSWTCSEASWNLKTLSLSSYVVSGDQIKIRFLFTSDGSVVYDGLYIDDITISGLSNWAIPGPPLTGTVAPFDSLNIPIQFNSTGLNAGQYYTEIAVNSNDPLSSNISIPCIINVSGSPSAAYSDTCLLFDTIMEFTSQVDTLWITNNGCDTLNINSISNNLPEFTFNIVPISSRINQSSDDAEEVVSTGVVDITSTDLELTTESGTTPQVVGMRFNNINIPQGATIINAYIEFECDEPDVVPTSITFNGEDTDSSGTFAANNYDVSSRTLTTATTNWNNIPPWTVDVKYQTPDISNIVQEIINRPGWTPGNSLSMIVNGSGERTAEAFDGVNVEAPLLVIEYLPIHVLPGDSAEIIVTFSPDAPGTYNDALLIQTNDGNNSICLNGTAYGRPIISFNPNPLDLTVGCNNVYTDTITIYNAGLTDLYFNNSYLDTLKSCFFDGTNDYVTTNLNIDQGTGNPGVTMEAWVYPNSVSTNLHFVVSSENGGYDWSILRNAGNWYIYTGAASVNTGFPVDINKWQHIAAVFIPGTGVNFYKNGQLFFTTSIGLDAADNNINIGRRSSGSYYFDGRIDEIRVWNIQRSQADIISTMNKELIGLENGLVGYWNFNDGTYNDLTLNNNPGTPYNGPVINQPNAPVTPSWLSLTNINFETDTILPGDSAIVGVTVSTYNQTVGNYTQQILYNSNDPLNSPDTLTINLEITGTPDFIVTSFEDTTGVNCLNLDTIMEYASSISNFYFRNNGCDTLFIDSINFVPSVFSLYSSTNILLPGQQGFATILFSPTSTGTFNGTANIYTNDIDTSICLYGFAVPKPNLNVDPDTFNLTINCNSLYNDSFAVYNTGLSPLYYNTGNSGEFDGTNNYVLMANSTQFDVAHVTMEAWVYSNNFNQSGFIFEKGPVNSQYSIFFEGANFCFRTCPTTGGYDSYYLNSASIGFTNGSWHHVAATYDGSYKRIYVDGILQGEQAYNKNLITGKLGEIIGAYGGTGAHAYYFNGRIDEVRVWNIARTQAEIISSMNAPLHGVNLGLIGYWNFDDETAADLSENNNDGTYYNGTVASPPNFNTAANPSWLSWNPVFPQDTLLTGDTAYIPFTINTLFQTLGNYTYPIILNSNDPLHYTDSLIINLTIVGASNFVLYGLEDTIGAGCLNHDTIMEFTSSTRDFYFANTGCDTLWIDSITCSPNNFSFVTSSPYVLPGDSGFVTLKFNPQSTGTFNGSANIYTNDIDTFICLYGYAYPRPILNITPNPLDITISCSQTITDTITLYNNGLTNLIYNVDTTNYCVFLDGNGDYIRQTAVTLPTPSSSMTIEAWIYPTAYNDANYNGIVSWGNRSCTGNGIVLSIQNSGRPSMATWCNDFVPSSGPVATLNNWNHIAMVLTGQSVTLYMNGQSITGSLPIVPIFSSNNLAIGCTDFPGRYFTGRIDEVKVWNVARNASQVNSDMYSVVHGNEPGLVSYWNFEDQTPNDLIGTNNGVLQGNAVILPETSGSLTHSFFTVQNNLNDTLIPGDSTLIPIQISSAGLLIGDYHDTLTIFSNDPLNSEFLFPINLTVLGTSHFVFTGFSDTISTNCLYLDSIMEFTTSVGDISFTNTGCDTLWIDSTIINPSSTFSVNSSPNFILPGDTGIISILFSPVSSGIFNNNLYLYTNETDTVFCLSGYAFPRPIVAFEPDTLYMYLNACQDTASDQLLVINSGLSDLDWNLSSVTTKEEDFDPSIDATFWAYNNGFISANCGSMSGNALYFNDAGVRQAQTVDFNTIGGGSIGFALHIGNGGSCETVDPGEDIVLEYSTNSGGSWTNISTYYAGTYSVFTPVDIPIPAGAKTVNTRFRWRQLSHSGTSYDHWALDNISIDILGTSNITFIPQTGITPAIDSTYVTVLFNDSGLVAGNYIFPLIITSNDPLNSILTSYLNVTIDSLLPNPPLTVDQEICFGNPNPPLIAIGNSSDTIKWYDSLYVLIHIGDTLLSSESTVGIYKYYVTSVDSITGCESQIDSVFLQINAAPAPPVVNNEAACFGIAVPSLISTGTNPLWYSDGALTSQIYTGNNYATGLTNPGVYTFYVADSTGGCPKSPADTVTLTIYSLPNSPVANDISACVAGPIPPLTATVTGTDSILWYNVSMNLVGNGNSYNTGQTIPGVYSYYVTSVDTVTGCESTPDSVSLTIVNTSQPVTNNVSACFGSIIPDLTATGTNILWYDSTMTLAFTGDPYNTGLTAIGTYPFYVTQTVNGCESSPLLVNLVINPIPVAPVSPDEVVCFGQTTPLLTASGTNIKWYNDPTLLSLIATGSPYNTGMTAAGTYTYYVTQTASGCTSLSDTVTLTINPLPATPYATSEIVCFGNPVPDLVANSIIGSDTVKWFDDALLTSLVYTGNPFSTTQTAVGTYTYYLTQTDTVSGCQSIADTVSLTINNVPVEPTADDLTICFGVSLAELTSTGNLPQWFDNAALNTVVATGNTYNTGITAVGTYTFYVTDSIAGCPQSPADTAILTIEPTPVAPVSSPQSASICFGEINPSFSATGTNIEWWNDPALTTLEFSGDPFTPVISATGTYSYYVTQTIGICSSPPDTIIFTINTLPVVNLGPDSTQCGGTITLDAGNPGSTYLWSTTSTTQTEIITTSGSYNVVVTDVLGCTNSDTIGITILPVPPAPVSVPQIDSICFGDPNPSFSATGTNIEWWSDPTITTLELTGDPFTPSITTPGIYSYYVTQTVTGCRGPSDTIQFIINFTPAPTASNVSVPFGMTVPDLTATGSNIQWFDNSMTLVYTGSSFATGITAIGIDTFYVSQTMNGCESSLDTAILTIYPGAPVSSDETICFGQTTPDLVASGTNIQWYSDPTLATLVGTGSPFATGEIAVGIYNYYVTQTINNVESPSDTVTLIINAIPVNPIITNQSVCSGGIIPDLIALGTNIQWYDSTMTFLFNGDTLATGQTSPGTYIYFVTQTQNGCESTPVADTLLINPLPAVPVAINDTAICFGNPVPDLTATGVNIFWHDSSGTIVGSGSPFNTGQTNPGTYLYYATQTDLITTCESPGDTVILSIISTSPPVAPDVSICFGLPVPDLTATGTNIQWFDTTNTLLYSGNTFSTGESSIGTYIYYVSQTSTVSGCISPVDTVYLTISSPPTVAPVVQDTNACFGTAVPDLVATTGTIINWYSDAGLTNLVFSGNPFATGMTTPGTYNYYVTDSTSGCPEGPSALVSLVINDIPATLAVNDTSVCFGNTVPDLVASGINVEWFDTTMTLLYSGNTFVTGITTAGTYLYLVTQTDLSTGCSSFADSVTLTIHSLPAIPVALDTTVCSASTIPDLTASGTNIQWYDTTNSFLFTGNSFTTGQTTDGIYTYYVSDIDMLTGCESDKDTSILTILLSPPTPTANDMAVCIGNPVPILTSTGTTVYWYNDAGLTNLVNTGNSFNTGQTSIGTYTYYVIDSIGGCSSDTFDIVTLSINPTPSQPLANDLTICYGDSSTLSATGNNPQWYNDPTLINMVGTGNLFNTGQNSVGIYTYYVSDFSAGCGNSTADTAVLTINPKPLVTANTFSTSIYAGESVNLIAYNAISYVWTPPTGLNTTTGPSVIASPTVNTTYTVTGTNTYGCSSDTTIFVLVNPIGIEEVNMFFENLKIYPNPASKQFTIEFSTTLSSPIQIYLNNILGEKVLILDIKETNGPGLKEHKYLIDTKALADGFYSIEFITNKGSLSKRIVLKK